MFMWQTRLLQLASKVSVIVKDSLEFVFYTIKSSVGATKCGGVSKKR